MLFQLVTPAYGIAVFAAFLLGIAAICTTGMQIRLWKAPYSPADIKTSWIVRVIGILSIVSYLGFSSMVFKNAVITGYEKETEQEWTHTVTRYTPVYEGEAWAVVINLVAPFVFAGIAYIILFKDSEMVFWKRFLLAYPWITLLGFACYYASPSFNKPRIL